MERLGNSTEKNCQVKRFLTGENPVAFGIVETNFPDGKLLPKIAGLSHSRPVAQKSEGGRLGTEVGLDGT